MLPMTFLTQLYKFLNIDLGMSYKVVWWNGGAVEKGELHALGIFYAVVQGFSPHRTHCLLLRRGLTEIEVVKVHDTVRVHYGENFASREGHWLQASGLYNVNHHITSESFFAGHV